MSLILLVWFCIGCAVLLPFPISMFVILGVAVLRILFLTHASAIDAGVEVISETTKLIQDVRRNGLHVLKVVFGWVLAAAVLIAVVRLFDRFL